MTFGSLSVYRIAFIGAAAALVVATTACSSIRDRRGYLPDADKIASISIGVDSKDSVSIRLGSPSTVGTFDTDVWYYISSEEEQFAFFAPKTINRDVLVITFDQANLVSDINTYTLADGKALEYVGRKTPTRGKELGFLEQMFGNIGRLPAPGRGERQ